MWAVLVGSIDQGTTGTRFTLYDESANPLGYSYREHRQIYPEPGWVEHDPLEILANTRLVIREAVGNAGVDPDDIGDYVRHRQSVAGLCAPNDWILDEEAIGEIYRLTDGIPRSVNQLCERALLVGYQRNKKVLGAKDIIDAMDALKSGDVYWSPASGPGKGMSE